MRKLLLIPIVLVLAGCGGDKTLQPLSPGAVVLAFGDSLTFGTGTTRTNSYPSQLADMTGFNVINAGVPGEISKRGVERLPGLLREHQPQLLILIHGGNDMLRRLGYGAAADNLKAMIQMARDDGVDVVMLGVPNPGLVLSSADFYAEVAEEMNVPIDEDAIADILQYPSNKSGQVHPISLCIGMNLV